MNLAGLQALGFRARAAGDTLILKPADKLTPELRQRILAVKAELLAELWRADSIRP
jgi:hypothetical protein